MPTHNEDIFQILREATEPLFPSEIAARLNSEFWASTTVDEVVTRLTKFKEHIAQLPDGRWILKRRME